MTPDAGRRARCTRSATRSASLEITSNAPSGPVPTDNPLVERAARRGRPAPRAQAGVDAGRRVRRRRRRRGQLRPRRPAARPHPRRARRRRRPRPRRTRSIDAFARGALMQLSPLLDELGTYPFARLTQARQRAEARGAAADRLRRRRAARGDARVHPRGARSRRSRPSRSPPTRSPPACPSCARRSPAGCGAASAVSLDPGIEILPTLGSKEAIYHLAQVLIGPGSRARPRRGDDAGLPRPRRAARASPAPASSRSRSTRSPAGCPTSTRSTRRPGGASR